MLTRLIRHRRNQNGFTLIELLVVVAIIALLTAFAVPKIFDAISNARNARGQSDMDTISGALDRYYFEMEDVHPHVDTATTTATAAADATAIKNALYGGYLKQTTTFVNGHKRGYLYVSNTAGEGYVLVDPKSLDSVTVTCGSGTTWTHDFAVNTGFQVWIASATGTGALTESMFASCTATAGTTFTTN